MKKLLLSLGLVAISTLAFAQSVTYGLRAGLNFAAIAAANQDLSVKQTTSALTTFSVAAFADFKFKYFSIQPAFALTGKGGQVNDTDGGIGTVNVHYLEVPINIIYHLPVPFGDVYVGTGPYVAFGATASLSVAGPGGNDSENLTFGSNGNLKSTEFGADGIAGIKFNEGFLVHLNYDLGLSNILNDSGDNASTGSFKTRTFGVSVGFVF
jgi:hypothetical protein